MASNYNQRYGSSGSPTPRRRVSDNHNARPAAGRPSVTASPGGRTYAPRSQQLTSTRIGDLNGGSRGGGGGTRRPDKRKSTNKVGVVLGIVVVLAVVAAVAYGVLRFTGAFPIENLSITGAEHLTNAEVTELASLPDDATLLTVDTDTIERRLEKDTWIEKATVSREFPNTLSISVKERTIAAVVEIQSKDSGTTKNWAIASDGMWLMPIPEKDSTAGQATSEKIYEDAEQVLHIEEVPYTTSPEMGAICTDSNVNNALGIVDGMTTELADRVKTVIASDPDSTTLILDNGVEIAFGTSEDIRTKERVCLQLLEQYDGEIAFINVRTVDNPTWRSA